VARIRPHEIYNLAAQSHVKVSFEMSEYTANADALGTLRLLNAMRICGLEKTCRFYQASTSELYGKVQEIPQRETTPFYPRSPYAVAKQYAYWQVRGGARARGSARVPAGVRACARGCTRARVSLMSYHAPSARRSCAAPLGLTAECTPQR